MLDPRSLEERREEIIESCQARHIQADVDEAIALHTRVNELRTTLNEANRLRNEHQKAGKQKVQVSSMVSLKAEHASTLSLKQGKSVFPSHQLRHLQGVEQATQDVQVVLNGTSSIEGFEHTMEKPFKSL